MVEKSFNGIPSYYCYKSRSKAWKKYIEKYPIDYLPVEFI